MVDFVWIHNPATSGIALQPELAVEQIWSKKGFTRVDVDLAEAAAALGVPALDVGQVPEKYVRGLIARRGAAASTHPSSPKASPEPETSAARRRASKES